MLQQNLISGGITCLIRRQVRIPRKGLGGSLSFSSFKLYFQNLSPRRVHRVVGCFFSFLFGNIHMNPPMMRISNKWRRMCFASLHGTTQSPGWLSFFLKK